MKRLLAALILVLGIASNTQAEEYRWSKEHRVAWLQYDSQATPNSPEYFREQHDDTKPDHWQLAGGIFKTEDACVAWVNKRVTETKNESIRILPLDMYEGPVEVLRPGQAVEKKTGRIFGTRGVGSVCLSLGKLPGGGYPTT